MPVLLTKIFGPSAKLAPSLVLLIRELILALALALEKAPETVSKTGRKWSRFGAVSENWGLANGLGRLKYLQIKIDKLPMCGEALTATRNRQKLVICGWSQCNTPFFAV